MGSRTRPLKGGSGAACSRINWAADKPRRRPPAKDRPFETIEDLELYLSFPLLTCLECGGDFKSLGHHLGRTHAMSSNEYRIKYNIPKGRSLCGTKLRELKRNITLGIWSTGVMENTRLALKERVKLFAENANRDQRQSTIHLKFYKKFCLTCGVEFTRKRKHYKFCSKKCQVASSAEQARLIEIAKKGGKTRGENGKRDDYGRFKKVNP